MLNQLILDSYSKAKPILTDVVGKAIEFLAQNHSEVIHTLGEYDVEELKERITQEFQQVFEKLIEGQEEVALEHLRTFWQEKSLNYQLFDWGLEALQQSLEYFFGDDWFGELSNTWQAVCADLINKFHQVEDQQMVDYKKIPNHTIIPGAPTVLPTGDQLNQTSGPNMVTAEQESNHVPSVPPEPIQQASKEEKLERIRRESETLSENKPPIPNLMVESKEEMIEASDNMEEKKVGNSSALMQSIIDNSKEEIQTGENLEEIKVEGLGTIKFDSIQLPEGLMSSIQQAAEDIVKKTIQRELESALENELKKYLENGIGDFLKKSS